MVEIFAGAGVLRGAPLFHRGIVPVLHPTVVVRDFDTLIFVDDRMLGGVWRLGNRWALSEGGDRQ
jgi:hypothetical protein